MDSHSSLLGPGLVCVLGGWYHCALRAIVPNVR